MSMHDRATAAVLAQLMMAADGAVFGIGVAYVAYRSFRKYATTSSALRRIRDAPCVAPSDLRSVLADTSQVDDGEKLVVVRGTVEVPAADKGNWKSFTENNPLASPDIIGEKYVILERTRTILYNEWRGVFRWSSDLRDLIAPNYIERTSSSRTMVPFILVEGDKRPASDYLLVNMEGSNQPLPLTTISQHLEPITSPNYTLLHAFFRFEYPVGVLDQEKILPLGKEITAVGLAYPKNGAFEIKSCKDLPYFLSSMTKDELVADLSGTTKVLMWSGIVFGAIAIGILGYSITRNWSKWKAYRHRRQITESMSDAVAAEVAEEDESEEIPDGELCVVCLTRRRHSCFIPCGHKVCCSPCALSVNREASPKCPVCRQSVTSSIRVYDS